MADREWEPREFTADPTVNALLNIAASLNETAVAIDGLLYGLKYAKREGMSVAEAIEVVGKSLAESVADVAQRIEEHR